LFPTLKIEANQGTIVVPDDYSTIQEAINAASEGDTVFVRSGYYEKEKSFSVININKRISLIGEYTESVINGRIVVTANNVSIEGFTIQNSGWLRAGIEVSSLNCRITKNKVLNNYWGIELSDLNVVSMNIVLNNRAGVSTSGHNNTIFGNLIENNTKGIELFRDSANNTVQNNLIQKNNKGIELYESSRNRIKNNIIRKNSNGICLEYSLNNIIIENEISYNTEEGILFKEGSQNNLIFHNNFIRNDPTVFFEDGQVIIYRQVFIWAETGPQFLWWPAYHLPNSWDDGYPSGGNYWSDYEGIDKYSGLAQDEPWGDGIFDDFYQIPNEATLVNEERESAKNRDIYPFTNPFPIKDITLEIEPEGKSIEEGDIAEFTVEICNLKNTTLVYNISIVGIDSTYILISSPSISLRAYEKATIPVKIRPSNLTTDKNYNLMIIAMNKKLVIEAFTLVVKKKQDKNQDNFTFLLIGTMILTVALTMFVVKKIKKARRPHFKFPSFFVLVKYNTVIFLSNFPAKK